MNRFERSPTAFGEARVQYFDGEYRILAAGSFVRCAVSGLAIPLDELRYWSVPLQEPYSGPEAALKRYVQIRR